MSRQFSRSLVIGLLLTGLSAHTFAAPVIVDFTATGSTCTYLGYGRGDVSCAGKTFSGTITYEIVGPTPTPTIPSPTRAISINGWVNSSFAMQWDTGSYATSTVPSLSIGNMESQSAQVLDNNEGIFDGIVLGHANKSYGEVDAYENSFGVALWSRILSWQNGLDFPTFLEMPPIDPIFGAVTEFDFSDFSVLGGHYTGVVGGGTITSLTTRTPTTAVAEPGSIALFAMGIVGLYGRRRRASLRNSNPPLTFPLPSNRWH